LEAIAGDSFENVMQRDVFTPLGLKNSGVHTPKRGLGVIPSNAMQWDTNIGDETPYVMTSGYYFSSTNINH